MTDQNTIRIASLERQIVRAAAKPDGTAHCQQCGSSDYEDVMYTEESEGYTNCCNERVNDDCRDRDDCHHLAEVAYMQAELAELKSNR